MALLLNITSNVIVVFYFKKGYLNKKKQNIMGTNKIYNEDCLETMAKMPNNFIDLTVTSPPYDNLRTYNGFHFDFESIANELFRVTKPGGVVVWIVNDGTINGSESGTSFKQALFFKEIGFNLHDTMIWAKDSLLFPDSTRYGQAFEYMFVFSNGKPKSINKIIDRKNIHFGGTIHGTTRGKDGVTYQKSNNNKTIIKEYGERFNVWTIPSAKNNTTGHPAVFPEKICIDHIRSWSNESDLVYDPFGGSGTTGISALRLNRNYILSEISAEYVEIANKRLDKYINQTRLF